jgi:hypothetical protein
VSEKRRDIRYPARIVARVTRRGERIELLTNDVSYRGAFLRTDSPPALRQLVRVAFDLPDGGAVVGAHAMVVHHEAPDGVEKVPGVGIQFWGPIDEAKAWETFIHDLKQKEKAGVPSARATDKIRRASERFRLALEVELGGRVAQTRDFSENGMAIRTELGMPMGVRASVRVNAPGRPEPLVVNVVVRRRIVEPSFTGLGVEFVDLSADARDALSRLIHANAPEDEDAIFIDPGDPGLH